LVLHSGGIPKELKKEAFEFFKGKAKLIYGVNDEYLTDERMTEERHKAETLFGDRLEVTSFEGVHEVNMNIIEHLIKDKE
jgi:hypothetical protein